MEPAHSTVPEKFYTLKHAAELLGISVETLLEWNDNNILKPTITQSGEIGYKEEQINKFLEIQKLVQIRKTDSENPDISQQNQAFEVKSGEDEPLQNPYLDGGGYPTNTLSQPNPSETIEQISSNIHHNNTANSYPKIKEVKFSKIKKNKLRSFGLISSFSFIIVLLIVITFTQQNKLNLPLKYNTATSQGKPNNLEIASQSQISKVKFLGSGTPALQVPIEGRNTSDNNLDNTGIAAAENKLGASNAIFEKESASTSASIQNQIPVVALLEQNGKEDITSGSNPININYGAIANFASKPNCPNCFKGMDTTVFDDNGNIKGETSAKDLLTTTLGTTGILQNEKPVRQTINSNILLAFLTLGLLSVIFAFKKQPAYSLEKSKGSPTLSPNFANDAQKQRILEIDQKTDGSVVLYFQGKEYKISKPELNSESDQFIERLLDFAPENVKEISYDIIKDEKIRLNAPLSKLVTRLGFVGLKRDLFFPRTSKNSVLFRRFITRQDLISMGLTPDQISRVLVN